jgi:hypothetical protein
MANLRKLTATGVVDLSGLSAATNLIHLDLSNGTFTNINGLRGLVNLERLNLSGCAWLTNLSALSDLPALIVVNLFDVPATKENSLQVLALGNAVQVVENTGFYGTPMRSMTFTLDDSHAVSPQGDELVLHYLLYQNAETNRYTMQLLHQTSSLTSDQIVSYELHNMSNVSIGAFDPENLTHAQIYLLLNTQLQFVAVGDTFPSYLKCDTELLLPSGYVSGPTSPTISIADSALSDAIGEYIFNAAPLLKADVFNLRKLVARSAEISSLSGLDQLRHLEYLDLSFNELEDFTGNVFPELTHLNLMHNPDLVDFDLLDSITYLNTIGTQVAEDYSTEGLVHDCDVRLDLDENTHELICASDDEIEQLVTFESGYSATLRQFYTQMVMNGNDSNIVSVSIYNGEDCDDPSGETLIGTLDYVFTELTITGVTGPDLITITGHGIEDSICVRHIDQLYWVNVIDANTLQLVDCVDLPSISDTITVSSIQFNHDSFALLQDKFFITFATEDDPIFFRLNLVFDRAAAQQYSLREGSLSADNVGPITEASHRTVTGATNATPIVITYSPELDDRASVNIYGVGGNINANGDFIINSLTSTTAQLVSTAGSGSYTDGGALIPYESSATGSLTLRTIHSPFINRFLIEAVVVHSQQDPTWAGLKATDLDKLIEFTNVSTEVVDNIDGDDIFEYTLHYNFLKGELDALSLPDPLTAFIEIDTLTYLEGAISTTQENQFAAAAEMGSCHVKIISTQVVEGFEVADLIVTLPSIGNYPIMVGPFSSIFHTTAQQNDRTYRDFVQVEFSSDIQSGVPVTGDIKIAAYKVGA